MAIVGGHRFSALLPTGEVKPGVYEIELADTERILLPPASEPGPLQSKDPTRFAVRIRPDREPQVQARLVGIGSLVVPGARLPFACRIQDDYAVTSARLCYLWHGEGDAPGGDGIEDLDAARAANRAVVSLESALELAPLGVPAGSRLSFYLEAFDNDDVSGPKSGKSATFLLRIVGEEELRADLLRREKEHRLELEGLAKRQEDVSTESESLLARIRSTAELDNQKRQLLLKLRRQETMLAAAVATLAEKLETVVAEVANNRLEEENGPLQRRLRDQIIDPMRALAGGRIPQAAEHLDRASRVGADAAGRNQAMAEAIETQQSILVVMREILAHLVKVEGYQEIINRLYETQKAQKDALDQTQSERQKRIRELLNPGEKK
jgi:hypothetical protein